MKPPRDIDGSELIKQLEKYGFQILRQKGSHVRLESSYMNAIFRLTIPLAKPLKPATLNSILIAVATHLDIDKQQLIERLFGK